jgi:hypothetical protein
MTIAVDTDACVCVCGVCREGAMDGPSWMRRRTTTRMRGARSCPSYGCGQPHALQTTCDGVDCTSDVLGHTGLLEIIMASLTE